MDRFCSFEDKIEILSDFIQKICDSGWSHNTRMIFVRSASKKFYRPVLEQVSGSWNAIPGIGDIYII